jgi:hypothetical protein
VRLTDADGIPSTYFQVNSDGDTLVPALDPGASWIVRTAMETEVGRLVAALTASANGGARQIAVVPLTSDEAAMFRPAIRVARVSVRHRRPEDIERNRALVPVLESAFEQLLPRLRPAFEAHAERLESTAVCAFDLAIDPTGRIADVQRYRFTNGKLQGDAKLHSDVIDLFLNAQLPVERELDVHVMFAMTLPAATR